MKRPPQSIFLDGPGSVPLEGDAAYRATVERLYALARSGTKFGLERIEKALMALGHPERGPRFVHVAGSNGKGSTCAFLSAVLARAPELFNGEPEVGLFTSPHLVSLTERVQFVTPAGSTSIPPLELVAAVQEVESAIPGLESLSFFEVVTAAALVAMRRRGIEVAVIEAGLGARLDATRLVQAEVSVLTDLSLEHTAILGESIEEIAAEEGAVVRPGRPLVMADGPPVAMKVVDRMAAEARAPVFRLGRDFSVARAGDAWSFEWKQNPPLKSVPLALSGPHQARNAALAGQAALLLTKVSSDALRAGLGSAQWPGRLERVSLRGVDLLLDGAQNPHAARSLAEALDDAGSPPHHVLFGVMRDKDVGQMLNALAPWAASWTFTRPSSTRARSPGELAAHMPGSSSVEAPAEALEHVLRLARRDGRPVLVCGSLYLVGDVRAIVSGGRVRS